MEQLRPKLYFAIVAGLIYDAPRVCLNVHTFGSLCTFYYNVVQRRYLTRDSQMIAPNPQQFFYDELLPPYLLKYVNEVQDFELPFELQHTSVALPFQSFSPKCSYHLTKMRDSLAFQIYFVMFDCIFLVAIISVIIYSTLYFFLELKKGVEFREKNSNVPMKMKKFWKPARIAFLSTAITQ